MINKEMKAAELASVTGGGWKTNLAVGVGGHLSCFRTYWNTYMYWFLQRLHGYCSIRRKDNKNND